MEMHLVAHDSLHRRMLEKRQRVVITTVITRPHTTVTTLATVRITSARATTTARTTSTTGRAVPTTTARTSAVVRPTTTATTTARPVASSVVPSVRGPVVTDEPEEEESTTESSTAVSTSTTPSEILKTVTETISSPVESATESTSSSTDRSGATSKAGQTAGIVVGVIAGVIGLAIFTAFIIRHMRKRRADKEHWDAAKFRRSALMLNDEKPLDPRTPRPPSMVERRGNVPKPPLAPSVAYPYSDTASHYSANDRGAGFAQSFDARPPHPHIQPPGTPQPYGSPNPYGAAPIPYTGQNMYGQVGDRGGYNNTGYGGNPSAAAQIAAAAAYGRGTPQPQHPGFPHHPQHNSLPPFASYLPPASPIVQQSHPAGLQVGVAPGGGAPAAGYLPNPFSERPGNGGSSASSLRLSAGSSEADAPTPPRKPENYLMSEITGDDAPPPAYSDDGTYAKLQRDVKTPVVMSVEGTSGSASGAKPAGSTAAPATVAAPAAAAPSAAGTASATADATNARGRPLSSHTVYDPADVYGGM